MEGYIKLHRKISDWEWYNDPNTFRLFMHLLLNANYEAKKWQGLDIQPGQLLTGRIKLAHELKLSEQEIRTSISKLKSTNEITIKSTNKFSVVTLNMWADYQDRNTAKQPTKQPGTHQTSNQQSTKYKEVKEDKEVKNNNIARFEEFWNMYDMKKGRKPCLNKWGKISHSDIERIFEHIPNYVKSTPGGKFRLNPLKYLTDEHWNDEITQTKVIPVQNQSKEPSPISEFDFDSLNAQRLAVVQNHN